MMHPDTELRFINKEKGYGVVATKFIPAGTITWVLDRLDKVYRPSQYKALEPIYRNILDVYTYRNNEGNFILCWDHARFVNHSFNSNCLSTAYDYEIAIRDIEKGEELTDDYGYLNVTEPFTPIDEGYERKTVYPDDLLFFYKLWDEQLMKVFNKIELVEQPLKSIIKKSTWKITQSVINGKLPLASTLFNYFNPNSAS
ncbi:MAG: SET domain-containing protein [Bacteroidota bacterium]|nr:SET domain-containing protein [Bacteroidota bacterium]